MLSLSAPAWFFDAVVEAYSYLGLEEDLPLHLKAGLKNSIQESTNLSYSGTPPYDHPVYKTTSLLRPYSFKPNVTTIESFYCFEDPVNATTS